MGPTASGKSDLAEAIAKELGAQLINADAFQMYKGLDIGTAKPENKGKYKLIDNLTPDEDYGVGQFARECCEILDGLYKEGRSAVVVGGTGLYIRAMTEQYDAMSARPDPNLREALDERLKAEGIDTLYAELAARDPELAAKTDPQNPARVRRALERLDTLKEPISLPDFRQIKLGLLPERQFLLTKIESRTRRMIKMGWLDEIEGFRRQGFKSDDPGFRAIGYRQLWNCLDGITTLEEAIATTIAATRQYAKRQATWLRSEPRLQALSHGNESEIFEQAWRVITRGLDGSLKQDGKSD